MNRYILFKKEKFNFKNGFSISVFWAIIIFCFCSFINSSTAIILGFMYTYIAKKKAIICNHKQISFLLKSSIIGIGFGIHIDTVLQVGFNEFVYIMFFVIFTLVIGIILGTLLHVKRNVTYLISSGTAICGGTAITAISAIIKSKSEDVSIVMSIIFILNALALFVFPSIGTFFNLTQHQFGLWCAIAIHDTSSVLGAAEFYGEESLKVATLLKLVKTLWIIPLSLFFSILFKGQFSFKSAPWFILIFTLVILFNKYTSIPPLLTTYTYTISKSILIVVLFLIGTHLSLSKIKSVGWKPSLLGFFLWVTISFTSLILIVYKK